MISSTVKKWNIELTEVMNANGMKTLAQQFETDIENILEKHIDTLRDIAVEEDLYAVLDDNLPDEFEAWYVDHEPIELLQMLAKYYE